jgi:hypothetical protein
LLLLLLLLVLQLLSCHDGTCQLLTSNPNQASAAL